LKLLKTFVANLTGAVQPDVLFPEKPVIHFYPEISKCPVCDTTFHVQKTEIKSLSTMDIGEFYARQTILHCPHGHGIFKSRQLQNLVPRGGTFGFDVIIEIGYSLFIHCRSNQDTMAALAAKNILISDREISYLGRKFIIYLALAHRQSQHALREFLMRRGGYILHVDGTCEGDSPNLFCGLDGLSELVLDTVKISSEKKDKLVPFFQGIKKQYGEPKALVHDMGKGILNAVAEVFPDTPDFICHFHFLRDIGKDLLNNDYTTLLKRLRKLKVRPKLRRRAKYLEQKINPDCHDVGEIIESLQSGKWQTNNFDNVPLITAYALIQWIFDYPKESDGYGFPFDHPYLDFYRRIQKVHILLGRIKEINFNDSAKVNSPFIQLYKAITITAEDNLLNELAQKLEAKIEVFDKLRCAMRIALPEGKNGINDNGDVSDMKSIEEKVTAFRKWILSNKHKGKAYSKMVAQIDKYWEKLFADPIPVVGTDGVVRNIQPQRTNNILERFFRDVKRQNRKKTGMASLNKVLQSILAETPLVQNLKNDEYMKIILNGCSSLAERFSQIDADQVQQEMAKVAENNDKIIPEIKKIIRDEELTIKFSALFSLADAK
jgi:hypothetical protein